MSGTIKGRVLGFAPDVVATLRRFPVPSIFVVLATLAALVLINAVNVLDEDPWVRIVAGLMTGASFATAGSLFAEARGRQGLLERVLIVVPAVVAAGLFQITDTRFALPYFLPLVGMFAMSLSLASGAPGDGQNRQDIFWWSTCRALATAAIAVLVGLLVAFGLYAIRWSMAFLLNLEIAWLFENWLLPVVVFLLIPLYWLSTLPRLDEYGSSSLSPDDFLVRSFSFIGQFILIPFVLAYAAILHVYAVQVALAGQLPQGLLSWLVLYFLLAGIVAWLLSHPAFMREKPLVKLFRRSWFWLTIVPLFLLGLATWVRIDAYGLTPLRVILIVIGSAMALLSLIFLLTRGRADIRSIPGLAGLVLLTMSVGPLNPENLARWQQLTRLEALLNVGMGSDGPNWTDDQRRAARAAFDHLVYDSYAEDDLRAVLVNAGIEEASGSMHSQPLRAALDIAMAPVEADDFGWVHYARHLDVLDAPVDLSETPYLLGIFRFGGGANVGRLHPYDFTADGTRISVTRDGLAVAHFDLGSWIARQNDDSRLSEPLLLISLEEGRLALLLREIFYSIEMLDGARVVTIEGIQALAFSDRPDL